jgi:hypothetical protein
MKEQYEGIEQALDVATELVSVTPEKKKQKNIDIDIEKDIKKDYEYSRAQLYDVISKGQEALDGILEVAGASDHPRAYEVAGQLIKSVSDATDKLIDLQKKMQDLEEGPKHCTVCWINRRTFKTY